jgi:hypothetical protein
MIRKPRKSLKQKGKGDKFGASSEIPEVAERILKHRRNS